MPEGFFVFIPVMNESLILGLAVLFSFGVFLFFVGSLAAIYRYRGQSADALSDTAWGLERLVGKLKHRADEYVLASQAGCILGAILIGIAYAQFFQSLRQGFFSEAEIRAWLCYGVMALITILFLGAGLLFFQIAKAVAYAKPEKVLYFAVLPMHVWAWVFRPVSGALLSVMSGLSKAVGARISSELAPIVSAQELSQIAEISSRAGEIEDEEKQMIQKAVIFSDTVVREIMTPRQDVVFVKEDAALPEIEELLIREAFSRVLVIGGDLDDVKGLLMAKDLLPLIGKNRPPFRVSDYLRPVYFVQNSKRIGQLLSEFKRQAIHFAVVLDEHGGVDGVVTLEDLMEEIVGEIFDEYDLPLEESQIVQTKSGDLLVHGSALVDDLNSLHGLQIPTGSYDTVAGLVMQLLGRIPASGEVVRCGQLLIKIEELSQHRVTRLRISRPRAPREAKTEKPRA